MIEQFNLREDKLVLPFKIYDGKLGDQENDIRYNSRNLTEWTKSLRYLFINCKHLITLQNTLECLEKYELI